MAARSRVDTLESDPLAFDDRHVRGVIPLVWMPWQRKMLEPYLHPPELPETELVELIDYGMRFVKRNDGDVLDTLLDLNDSIYREYKYAQGTTTLATTPFEVYATRRGVCQDFSNLMICLARLMGVPARYVCGYVVPHPTLNANQRGAGVARLGAGLPARGRLARARPHQRRRDEHRARSRRRGEKLPATPRRRRAPSSWAAAPRRSRSR